MKNSSRVPAPVDVDDEELGSFDAPPNAIDGFRVTPSADVPALESESWARGTDVPPVAGGQPAGKGALRPHVVDELPPKQAPESFGWAGLAEPVCAKKGAFGDSAAPVLPHITAIRKAMIRIIYTATPGNTDIPLH